MKSPRSQGRIINGHKALMRACASGSEKRQRPRDRAIKAAVTCACLRLRTWPFRLNMGPRAQRYEAFRGLGPDCRAGVLTNELVFI